MKSSNRLLFGALLLVTMGIAFTQPADARRRGRIHVTHHHHDGLSSSPSSPSHTNPWAKEPEDSSPISSGTLWMLLGTAVALGGGWFVLRALVKRAQADPEPWSPQARQGQLSERGERAARAMTFEARMREKVAQLDQPRSAGFGHKMP